MVSAARPTRQTRGFNHEQAKTPSLDPLQGHRGGRSPDSTDIVDAGWKDTVLVMPQERVHILLRFEDCPGLFLYHCHMLEHEDAGLMRNYRVTA